MTIHPRRPGRRRRREADPDRIFDTVVCAVDGTPAGVEAARQADALMPPGRTLHLVTVIGEAELEGGWGTGYIVSSGEWPHRLEPALGALAGDRQVEATPIYQAGPRGRALVEELSRRQATLVVLGGHDHRHLPPVLLDVLRGSVAAHLLHDSPCSVLIARSDHGRPRRFRTIAAGYDGSSPAGAALRVAEALASRLGARLASVDDPPAAADGIASTPSPDLVVLGGREAHGIRALGSAGDRVAETSDASVLVVRDG